MAEGKDIVTIEGLDPSLHQPLEAAWIPEDILHCGCCQPGQIMAAAVLLKTKPKPTGAGIEEAMRVNICRCGRYPGIKKTIHTAGKL